MKNYKCINMLYGTPILLDNGKYHGTYDECMKKQDEYGMSALLIDIKLVNSDEELNELAKFLEPKIEQLKQIKSQLSNAE